MKDLTFAIFTRFFPTFSRSNATASVYWKHLLSFLLMEFIAAFLFFIQSGESIYDPPQFDFVL